MYCKLEKKLQEIADRYIDTDAELGIQVAVSHRGRPVAEVNAGFADPGRRESVTPETLFPVFSVTKAFAATLVHLLAQDGLLNYDAPLYEYWPEFRGGGRDAITLRSVLNHTAGLPQMPSFHSLADIVDFEGMCRRMTRLEPLWEPGTEFHYHAITFGWLVGKVLRNVGGMDFNTLARERLGSRCSTRFYCGMSRREAVSLPIAMLQPLKLKKNAASTAFSGESVNAVMAETVPLSRSLQIARLAIPPQLQPLEGAMNLPEVRMCCIPSSTGILTAGFAAEVFGRIVHGELLNPALLDRVVAPAPPARRGEDPFGSYGLGYGNRYQPEEPGRGFGHGGYGGSCVIADRRHDFAFALCKNRMSGHELRDELYQAIGQELA